MEDGRKSKRIELCGQRFGRLEVLEYAGPHKSTRQSTYLCRCDCGNEKVILSSCLRNGQTRSCGCSVKDRIKEPNQHHSKWSSRAYRIWGAMKKRCYNPNSSAYYRYGGRGITVCDRWRDSFDTFLKDMGEPGPKGTIDRIDNSGNYCPENCRWITQPEQMRNTCRNRPLTFQGRTMLLIDWAAELGIKPHTLIWRIKEWGLEKALSVIGAGTYRRVPKHARLLTYNGETKTLTEWAWYLGISVPLLSQRIKRHGLEHAIVNSTPRHEKA